MLKKLLIDASHTEEVRVALVHDNLLEEFDSETTTKKITKGNVYLAKVVRVEPSLQAAFVEYGNGRQGFLSFAEIHPDYYQIPVSERLTETEIEPSETSAEAELATQETSDMQALTGSEELQNIEETKNIALDVNPDPVISEELPKIRGRSKKKKDSSANEEPKTEVKRQLRYKIQEVIKRRQILLVQVIKEERGNKGAAMTTYLSLAGRYCVLMPNAHKKVVGVSRKIDDNVDRTRLKDMIASLNVPEGMSLIIRTAGQEKRKPEIKRDYEYLVNLWNIIRENTLKSIAPALIHEEGDLVTRAIRDMYTSDINEILIEGDDAHKNARSLMKQMIPSHVKKVHLYKNPDLPLFHAYQVENQLENMMLPRCTLPSGGYIIINPTEALVSIDINSGKSTRERNIDETALNTNLEAADEIARQLRLRDLSGLVVIDFIDMQDNKHIQQVERRIKDATKNDRARIQIGRISQFGLLEMSRQRLRPSLIENNTTQCQHCHGSGHVRSTESTVLQIIRAIETEAIKGGGIIEIVAQVPKDVDLYLLNKKRGKIVDIEKRFNLLITIERDEALSAPLYNIDVIKERILSQENTIEEKHEAPQKRQQKQLQKPAQRQKQAQKPIHNYKPHKEISKTNAIESAIVAEISPTQLENNKLELQNTETPKHKKRNFRHKKPKRLENHNNGESKTNVVVELKPEVKEVAKQELVKQQLEAPKKSSTKENAVPKSEETEAPKQKKGQKGWLRRLLDT